MNLVKPSALVALLLGSAAPAAFYAPAHAADAASASGGDVVVTARRRDEQLKDVPIAVTSFSSQRLEQLNAQDNGDMAPTVAILAAADSSIAHLKTDEARFRNIVAKDVAALNALLERHQIAKIPVQTTTP